MDLRNDEPRVVEPVCGQSGTVIMTPPDVGSEVAPSLEAVSCLPSVVTLRPLVLETLDKGDPLGERQASQCVRMPEFSRVHLLHAHFFKCSALLCSLW